MDDSHRENLSRSRVRLQNPYAYVEDLETESESNASTGQQSALAAKIHASRLLLENQYAYVDDGGLSATDPALDKADGHAPSSLASGRQSAEPIRSLPRSNARRTPNIEGKVREAHKLLWKHRDRRVIPSRNFDPADLLNPGKALELVGYRYELAESLGQFHKGNQSIEVAGLIDNGSRLVQVSRQFVASVRRFTLAHELGHALLHGDMGTVHRDRPLDGASVAGDTTEREADRFATLFLMPAKLVRLEFEGRFLSSKFVVSDATLFAVGGEEEKRLRRNPDRRAISMMVAGLGRFDGRNFYCLADQFGVSISAMAIRLEELDLT